MTLQAKHSGSPIDLEATFDGDLIVRAIVEDEIEHASATGNAFIFYVAEAAIDTTDTVLFVKNDDPAILVLDRCTLNSDAAEIMSWFIAVGTASTVPAGGSVITPTNLYPTFAGKTFDHVARTDETAVAQGTVIERHLIPVAGVTHHIDLHGLLLGKGHYVQFDITGTTPVVGMSLWAHWEVEAV